jgi:hypothetical protein
MQKLNNLISYKHFSNITNEGVLGDFLKIIKDKISKNYSKLLKNPMQIDKIIEDYKKEILNKLDKKLSILKQFGEFIQTVQNGELDTNKSTDLLKQLSLVSKIYAKDVELLKKKYDAKIDDVKKNETNQKTQNYIILKKLELEQELNDQENKALLLDGKISEKLLQDVMQKDKNIQKLIYDLKNEKETLIKNIDEQKIILDKKEDTNTVDSFDIKKAKENEKYIWLKSPYTNMKFDKDQQIIYFSANNSKNDPNYIGTEATIIDDKGAELIIKTLTGVDPITITKDKIISVSNLTDKQQETINKISPVTPPATKPIEKPADI